MNFFRRIFSRTSPEDLAMVEVLSELCVAYMANDRAVIDSLEPRATEIGEEMNQRGGLREMQRIFDKLDMKPGSHMLEMHWSGIGEWQA